MNIQKTLFREFSCLLNYDIENQIRKNNDAINSLESVEYNQTETQKDSDIDNLLYKFYQSLTKMFSSQPEVRAFDKRMNEKYDLSGLHYASIFNDRIREKKPE